MSQENVELANRAPDAFNRGDLDAFLALCDPDLEFYSRLAAVEGGSPYRGFDGIRAWWENLRAAWRDLTLEIDEVTDLGDVTITQMRLRGHGMDSDAPWEQAQWHVVEWRNGKAIWWRTFLSKAEALEAAGPRE
jgi:ketosteroid isomerase-like protein